MGAERHSGAAAVGVSGTPPPPPLSLVRGDHDANAVTILNHEPDIFVANIFEQATNLKKPLAGVSSKTLRFSHVFSGPPGHRDGLAHFFRAMSMQCAEYEVLHGEQGNLADDVVWERRLEEVKRGALHGKIGAPPLQHFLLNGERARLRTQTRKGRRGPRDAPTSDPKRRNR